MAGRPVTDRTVAVLGQQIRVRVRAGHGVPLVLCNGIGASLEVLDPLVAHLDSDTTVVRFDAPGTGVSPDSPVPYGFPYLAAVLGRLLKRLGLSGPVDVMGFSWGGALAQQFAFQNPVRCRRLILVATATGALMVPTLIVAGTDDPIIPVANARIMAGLLPHATLHLHPGGHMDLITNAADLAPVIEAFRGCHRPVQR